MKKAKRQTFDQRYPTVAARAKADAAIDALPSSTPIGQACRVWLIAYEAAGGLVKYR